MRRCYLLCYDVSDPKRLRRVHKIAKAYGEPWQYSVFYCTLRDIDRVRMERDLMDAANLKEDQVLIIDLGPRDESVRESVTTLGASLPEPASRVLVI
ncbi:MAG: CRISPR-associated endonuclease Cas2 [Phycisphaeraceae bacterium]|nr:CRISPR-associated endonuclease Cas2 [Phycisphaeraceae bacterium]